MTHLISDATVFDLETDGRIDELSKIHSLVIDDNNEVMSCADHFHHPSVSEGVRKLRHGKKVMAHNGINFDFPVLEVLEGGDIFDGVETLDSLVLSRLAFPDMKDLDHKRWKGKVPGRLVGSHSLEAWGFRLGNKKGDFGSTTDWKEWSPEMQTYCEQDVQVNKDLRDLLDKENLSPESIELEHRFARLMYKMNRNGFGFHAERAVELYIELGQEHDRLKAELQKVFPPKVVDMKAPKYWIATTRDGKKYAGRTKAAAKAAIPLASFIKGHVEGVTFERGPVRYRIDEFNPASRQQIGERLEALGWVPRDRTDTGLPKISDEILKSSDIPEAQLMAKYLLLEKRIGQLAEGDQGWIKVEVNGKIHGYVNTNGAVTGRCSHSKPNVAQVPGVVTKKVDGKEVLIFGEGSSWSTDFRALWRPTRPGWFQVGADASGLELRALAHFLGRYDEGEYARLILEHVR